MERLSKTVDNAQLLESYRQLLPAVDELPLRVCGSSMAPFLVHERDTVWLSRIDRPLKVGDIVLYRRDNGVYVLHRVCALEGEGRFCMVGDAQIILEHGVRREQIFAVVRRAERKGNIQAPGCFWWEFFEKVWVRVISWRPRLLRLYGTARKRVGRGRA